ncbi:cupin domain-containing protein [Kangiella sp. TOML190]|uniref:cupin domain-containing protein n=1 Tax=Kangiella sp. TOML190 TaxID=2931351 RepID=UPI00203A4E42|nr:cupin domain-containing protein [Kangiella sp. TOML190]
MATIFNSNISADTFFKDYWQRKPLLIRGAFANDFMHNLITAEELAGFSLEAEIESRLITNLDNNWQLEHGPLTENLFQELPEHHWILLVQSLDYFHSPLQNLIKACDFMPRWRLDDVMVSFATNHGGVGAHLDQYDVFLIQGQGQRRWRVGHKDQLVTHQQSHPEIAQIEAFTADLDVQVEAGDLLYIPPNTPHWGESIGDSMCYSVGFRAPNLEAIAQQLFDDSSQELNQLWQDQGILKLDNASGELPNNLSGWAQQQIIKITLEQKLPIAIGKELTRLKYPELLEAISPCEAQELSELAMLKAFRLNPISRLAFVKADAKLLTFVNGDDFAADQQLLPILEALNKGQLINSRDLTINKDIMRDLLSWLISNDALVIE